MLSAHLSQLYDFKLVRCSTVAFSVQNRPEIKNYFCLLNPQNVSNFIKMYEMFCHLMASKFPLLAIYNDLLEFFVFIYNKRYYSFWEIIWFFVIVLARCAPALVSRHGVALS